MRKVQKWLGRARMALGRKGAGCSKKCSITFSRIRRLWLADMTAEESHGRDELKDPEKAQRNPFKRPCGRCNR